MGYQMLRGISCFCFGWLLPARLSRVPGPTTAANRSAWWKLLRCRGAAGRRPTVAGASLIGQGAPAARSWRRFCLPYTRIQSHRRDKDVRSAEAWA